MTASKIRNYLKKLPFLIFLCLMLLFPSATLLGASSGLLLWFNTILPVLLPFIIISGLVIRLGIITPITKLLYPVFHFFLPVSKTGCYPVFIGFLSGIPMGAKTVADLMEEAKLSKEEGEYLAPLCNNASPMFLLNYAAALQLKTPSLGIPLCIILYCSTIISSFLAFPSYCKQKRKSTYFKSSSKKFAASSLNTNSLTLKAHSSKVNSSITNSNIIGTKSETLILTKSGEDKKKQNIPSLFTHIDICILNGFEVITKIGGYVILFSILAAYIKLLPLSPLFCALLSGILEITTGIQQISLLTLPVSTKFFIITVIAAFGGFSSLAQTQSVLACSKLSITAYIKAKLINALIAAIISLIFLICYL